MSKGQFIETESRPFCCLGIGLEWRLDANRLSEILGGDGYTVKLDDGDA